MFLGKPGKIPVEDCNGNVFQKCHGKGLIRADLSFLQLLLDSNLSGFQPLENITVQPLGPNALPSSASLGAKMVVAGWERDAQERWMLNGS